MAEERTPQGVQVNVKLAPKADRPRGAKALSSVPGLRKLTQTFPDETDPELLNLYVLEIEAPMLSSALDKLRQNPDVEYAEAAAPRKLI